jgi:cysteine-rich repeat protein
VISCGNGVLDMGEQCDLGAANANTPAIEVSQAGGMTFTPRMVSRFNDARIFYGNVSASAHTGYEALETSNLFLYRDLNTGLVSLFAIHGIDQNSSGLTQPASSLTFNYSGVPAGAIVVVSDDPGELLNVSPGTFTGTWNFFANTDGGVLQGFPVPGNWTVVVHPTWRAGIRMWRWVDEPNAFRGLTMATDVIIRARSMSSMCRANCTVPRCGDGIWDAGEVCDDGNVLSGDGCAADCRSVP